jgi:hypothetical protein
MIITLRTGERLPNDIKESLKNANSNLTRTKNHQNYANEIAGIFGISPKKIGLREKYFLGGFIEGEGSINVSAKKLRNAAHGILIDPEFSISQHVNGVELLYLALITFQTGRIHYKSGSNATLVLVIDNRGDLENKVVPFYKSYVNQIGSTVKTERVKKFQKVLWHLKNNHQSRIRLELF